MVIGTRLKKSNEQVQALQTKLYRLKQKQCPKSLSNLTIFSRINTIFVSGKIVFVSFRSFFYILKRLAEFLIYI